jgi:hypothetical protein
MLYNILVNIREEEPSSILIEDYNNENKEDLSQNQYIGQGYYIIRRESTQSSKRRDEIAKAI